MAKLDYKLNGFAELHQVLDQLPTRVQGRVQYGAARAGATVIKREVKTAAPRQDSTEQQSKWSKLYGRLHENIRVIKLKRNAAGERQARVDTGNAFWGVILEVGSRYIPAKPWFSQAVTRATPAALEKIKDSLSKGIDRESKKLVQETGANR